jgi:hypothetical protein
MQLRKIISKRIRRDEGGIQVAGDVNAVVSANVGQPGSSSHVSSRQTARVVQQAGRRKRADAASETETPEE